MKLFTIGPVDMLPEIKKIAGEQIPYFRTDEFSQMMLDSDCLLKKFMNADNCKSIYLTASGTAAMEATLMNCLRPNDNVLIINGGTFGKRFCEICDIHKYNYMSIDLNIDEQLTRQHLESFEKYNFSALIVNIHETSTGQLYNIELLSEFCKKKNIFLIVDAISSFLCDPYDMNKYNIDATIISSQKGLCIAPGLSIIVLSERILRERVNNNNIRSLYFDFKEYINNFERGQTPFTPCVGICLEMNKALKIIEDTGLQSYLNNIKNIALDFRNRIKSLPVQLPTFQLSNAITPIIFHKPIAMAVFQKLKDDYQIIVNPTGGKYSDYILRISHIGATTIEDNKNLVNALEKIISHLDI
ncbi:pyridoxal-phosphate-dependent aminotransferase family protein [Gallibacterium anatis]|uniref:pyridoxal-phosphate-dependent aminotransferase family protein n=1 Tax=Gallibacterium anatis TaxID=750 RepID=UPI000531E51E|nr:aminotransferase class V-fold PLP-dependent enzyme [Gallibacterium anatis]KGQ26450.1 hypothetical protein JP31_06665 [Gallibacterium anatis]